MALVLVTAGAYAVPRLDGRTAPAATPDAAAPAAVVPVAPATAARTTPAGRPATLPRTPPQRTTRPRRVVVPATGPGTYTRSDRRVAPTSRSGRVYRVDVAVEKGIGLDADDVALTIARTLGDARSWRGTGRWRFRLVAAGERADLHAYLVTPGTTDRLCAPLLTRGEVSCQAGDKVVLNARRWVRGAPAYGDDVRAYRTYLVNHEFGHALGYGHLRCPRRGAPAPVMLQQTKGLDGCRANPWPRTTGD